VVIHDAARPFVDDGCIVRLVEELEGGEGALTAVPLDETLKRVENALVTSTVDRSGAWRALTPQAFRTAFLRDAFARARAEGFEAINEAQLVVRYGGRVAIVTGSRRNLKITSPDDFELAQRLARGAS
jgi:2-C-methyl-D-erythritol 4-phosphate cytidylyltransferase